MPQDRDEQLERLLGTEVPERRSDYPLRTILRAELVTLEHKLQEHIDGKLDAFKAEFLKEIRSAFPNDDPAGHRRAHESAIQNANRWSEFRFGLLKHVANAVVLAAVIYVGVALYEHFVRGIVPQVPPRLESKDEIK